MVGGLRTGYSGETQVLPVLVNLKPRAITIYISRIIYIPYANWKLIWKGPSIHRTTLSETNGCAIQYDLKQGGEEASWPLITSSTPNLIFARYVKHLEVQTGFFGGCFFPLPILLTSVPLLYPSTLLLMCFPQSFPLCLLCSYGFAYLWLHLSEQ